MKFGGMNLGKRDNCDFNKLRASEIIEKCLNILNDEKKLKGASVSQLTGAISSLSDNFLAEAETSGAADDPLSKSILELSIELKSDKPK